MTRVPFFSLVNYMLGIPPIRNFFKSYLRGQLLPFLCPLPQLWAGAWPCAQGGDPVLAAAAAVL